MNLFSLYIYRIKGDERHQDKNKILFSEIIIFSHISYLKCKSAEPNLRNRMRKLKKKTFGKIREVNKKETQRILELRFIKEYLCSKE